jgi:hypothetical protein
MSAKTYKPAALRMRWTMPDGSVVELTGAELVPDAHPAWADRAPAPAVTITPVTELTDAAPSPRAPRFG